MRNKTRPRCRSRIQTSAIRVVMQVDHMTESLLGFIYLPQNTHIHSIMFLVCLLTPVALKEGKLLSKHAHGLTQHWMLSRRQSAPSPLLVPVSSSFRSWIQPLGSPCHIIPGCVSPQTIWALRGLVDLQPAPLREPAVRGEFRSILSFASNFLSGEWKEKSGTIWLSHFIFLCLVLFKRWYLVWL